MQPNLVLTAMIVLSGGLMFLRLVAKEKHRRDKHLLLRLQTKLAAEAAADAAQAEAAKKDRRTAHVAELAPVVLTAAAA